MSTEVRFVAALEALVDSSYANHTRLHAYLEQRASLAEIVEFVEANGGQPAYDAFLSQWLDHIPASIERAFRAHLRVEIDEDHAGLARRLVAHVRGLAGGVQLRPALRDPEMAALIAYSFAPERTRDRDVGYFLGCFLASERLSATRCGRLYRGFRRNGVAAEHLAYLELHAVADLHHGDEVGAELIVPVLAEQPALRLSILEGATDRVARATAHALWYESHALGPEAGTVAR